MRAEDYYLVYNHESNYTGLDDTSSISIGRGELIEGYMYSHFPDKVSEIVYRDQRSDTYAEFLSQESDVVIIGEDEFIDLYLDVYDYDNKVNLGQSFISSINHELISVVDTFTSYLLNDDFEEVMDDYNSNYVKHIILKDEISKQTNDVLVLLDEISLSHSYESQYVGFSEAVVSKFEELVNVRFKFEELNKESDITPKIRLIETYAENLILATEGMGSKQSVNTDFIASDGIVVVGLSPVRMLLATSNYSIALKNNIGEKEDINGQIIFTNSYEESIKLVSEGSVEYALIPNDIFHAIVEKTGETGLYICEKYSERAFYSYQVFDDDIGLVNDLNKVIPYLNLESIRLDVFEVIETEFHGSTTIKHIVIVFISASLAAIITWSIQEERAKKKRNYFFANMSHELRTPLNSILGYSKLLKSFDCIDDEKNNYLKKINKSAKNLLFMVNDMLFMSDLLQEQYNIVVERFNLREELSDILNIS